MPTRDFAATRVRAVFTLPFFSAPKQELGRFSNYRRSKGKNQVSLGGQISIAFILGMPHIFSPTSKEQMDTNPQTICFDPALTDPFTQWSLELPYIIDPKEFPSALLLSLTQSTCMAARIFKY